MKNKKLLALNEKHDINLRGRFIFCDGEMNPDVVSISKGPADTTKVVFTFGTTYFFRGCRIVRSPSNCACHPRGWKCDHRGVKYESTSVKGVVDSLKLYAIEQAFGW